MLRAASVILAAFAAFVWLSYLRSLPPRVGLGSTGRDASTLAIGVGVFLLAQGSVARHLTRRPALPSARIRSSALLR